MTKPGLLHCFGNPGDPPLQNLHELPTVAGSTVPQRSSISGGGHRSLQATSTWSRFGMCHNKQSSLIGWGLYIWVFPKNSGEPPPKFGWFIIILWENPILRWMMIWGVPIIFGNTHMDVGVDVGVAPMVRWNMVMDSKDVAVSVFFLLKAICLCLKV